MNASLRQPKGNILQHMSARSVHKTAPAVCVLLTGLVLNGFLLSQAKAASQSDGDFYVNASGTQSGNLTADGFFSLTGDADVGGSLFLGNTVESTPRVGASWIYSENGTTYSLENRLTRSSSAFIWSDNAEGTLRQKLSLSSNNTFSLFDASGQAKVVIDPNLGKLTIAVGASSGISLDATSSSIRINDKPVILGDSSGRIGIGTSTPAAALQIKQTGENDTGGIRIYQSLTNNYWSQFIDGNGTFCLSYNGTGRVGFAQGGSLGIGGLTPKYPLHVIRTSENIVGVQRIGTTSIAAGIVFKVAADMATTGFAKGGIYFQRTTTNAAGKMHIALGSTANSTDVSLADSKMTVNYDGNVGIGTVNPSTKLEVAGNLKVTGTVSMPRQGDILMGEFGNPGD